MKNTPIKHTQDYIEQISNVLDFKDTNRFIITYRGESKEYSTPCIPNIYREDYLENAISAQHDGTFEMPKIKKEEIDLEIIELVGNEL